jgi:hypothetical protein
LKAPQRSILTLIVLWFGLISTVASADIYQGKVVDANTGEPLAGAVVAVIWYRNPVVSLYQGRSFHGAQETLTDNEGKFLVEASAAADWSPFTYIVKEPDIVIYQPGYGPLSPSSPREFRSRNDLLEALKRDVVIKLAKLETKEELAKFASLVSLGIGQVALEKIPNLIRAINVQSKMVGVRPYPAPQ